MARWSTCISEEWHVGLHVLVILVPTEEFDTPSLVTPVW